MKLQQNKQSKEKNEFNRMKSVCVCVCAGSDAHAVVQLRPVEGGSLRRVAGSHLHRRDQLTGPGEHSSTRAEQHGARLHSELPRHLHLLSQHIVFYFEITVAVCFRQRR